MKKTDNVIWGITPQEILFQETSFELKIRNKAHRLITGTKTNMTDMESK